MKEKMTLAFTGNITTDLFDIKKKNTIDFYIQTQELQDPIIKSLQSSKTLLIRYNPIIADMIQYKELKKIQITKLIKFVAD